MGKRVKIIEDVPKQDLDGMIAVHKNDGAQVGYKEQSNGKYRIEAVFENTEEPASQLETVRSEVSGDKLTPG